MLIGAGGTVWFLAVLMGVVMMTPARGPTTPTVGWVIALLNTCRYLIVPAVLLGAGLLVVGWLRTEHGEEADSTSVSSKRDRDAD